MRKTFSFAKFNGDPLNDNMIYNYLISLQGKQPSMHVQRRLAHHFKGHKIPTPIANRLPIWVHTYVKKLEAEDKRTPLHDLIGLSSPNIPKGRVFATPRSWKKINWPSAQPSKEDLWWHEAKDRTNIIHDVFDGYVRCQVTVLNNRRLANLAMAVNRAFDKLQRAINEEEAKR